MLNNTHESHDRSQKMKYIQHTTSMYCIVKCNNISINTMKVSILRQISKFADNLVNFGYDDNTDVLTLLADMGFAILPNNFINILTFSYETERRLASTFTTNCIGTMFETTNIKKLITICDELCIKQLTNFLIRCRHLLHRTMDNHIINYNHNYHTGHIIAAYNIGYTLLYNAEYVFTCLDLASISVLKNCINNGMYIKNIYYGTYVEQQIDAIRITDIEKIDINFWYFQENRDKKNLIELNSKTIRSINLRIDDPPFAVICDIISLLPALEAIQICGSTSWCSAHVIGLDLEQLNFSIPHAIRSVKITNNLLDNITCKLFVNIRELYISNCHVSTKYIVPNAVKRLSIDNTNINDNMIRACTKIKYLSIQKNNGITTCAPFANSLVKLYVDNNYGINDGALRLCTKLVVLSAANNPKITTCDPFANSLKILDASESCGICDGGLKLCFKLKRLDASFNPKITTCKPFARTLMYLRANSSTRNQCGIADDGIKLCTKLIELHKCGNNCITLKLPIIYDE